MKYVALPLEKPISVQPDQTFGSASLRDAVADEAYRFVVCVVCDGAPLVRYYAKTKEAADEGVRLLEGHESYL